MRKVIYLCLFLTFSFIVNISFATSYNRIKLAIFDNPQPDPSRAESTQELLNAYQAGINTAIEAAQSKGITITEKDFFHGTNLADIIQQAANVKTWDPDVVLGFNGSNDFIMSMLTLTQHFHYFSIQSALSNTAMPIDD